MTDDHAWNHAFSTTSLSEGVIPSPLPTSPMITMRLTLALHALGVRIMAALRPDELGDHHTILAAVRMLHTTPIEPASPADPPVFDYASDGDLSAVVRCPRDIPSQGLR